MRTHEEWQSLLGLSDWTIEFRGSETLAREGECQRDDAERYAMVKVDIGCPLALKDYVYVHELLHIVFRDVEWYMKQSRSIEDMELADEELELTINTIAKALTGAEWYPWHRDSDFKKRQP